MYTETMPLTFEIRSFFDAPTNTKLSNDMIFHSSFHEVEKNVSRWLTRFKYANDQSVAKDLYLFYLLASKKFFDHRHPSHMSSLFLSIYLMQKTLSQKVAFSPQELHIKVRWLPGTLNFPFSKRSVLGCLVSYNALDKYELFDEENLCLAFQKQYPDVKLVQESLYQHTTKNKNLKIHYFEVEKKDGSDFSLDQQNLLKNNVEERVRNSVQKLSPSTFMKRNEEETYKTMLVLSNEISSLEDLPQAAINLDEHTGKEIIFQVVLVHPAPFHNFSLKERFLECTFVPKRMTTVKHLDDHPIQAQVFSLHLNRTSAFLRTDGSLDFNLARQKVGTLLHSAIGAFRDYNGGLLFKQQEHLGKFKDAFPEADQDILEKFFYSIAPLEKQAILDQEILLLFFKFFLDHQKEKLQKKSDFIFYHSQIGENTYLFVKGNDCSLGDTIASFIHDHFFQSHEIAYSILNTLDGIFFTVVLLNPTEEKEQFFTKLLNQKLRDCQKKIEGKKVLKIGVEYMPVSLDPRIGGDNVSADTICLLFEGLMRYDDKKQVVNGMAHSIEISADAKQYIFKLRQAFWNDGTSVTAHDFEYAWKKILSPDFKTIIAESFYPIKNALKAKQGKVPLESIGVQSIDDRTLKVELEHPTPFFLQLTALAFYSPVHRIIDQKRPQWPYECESNYPCNGPFQLKINQPNQGFQLTRNPFYWDVNYANWDQINLIHVAPSQALHAFQNDEVDWIGNPFGAFNSEYIVKKIREAFIFPNNSVCWQVFNTTCPPFHSRKIREAFSYAMDRESIVSNAFFPLNPAFSPLLHRHTNANHETLFPSFDPSKARQLFHEGLSELNLSINDLQPLTLIYNEGEIREYTAHCLKIQYKETLGLECELKPLPWNKLCNQMTLGNFQLGLFNWSPLIDDPLHKLNCFRFSTANVAHWEHLDYQNLLHLSEQQINPFQRSSYLVKAEKLLRDEMPVIPIFYQPALGLVKKNLQVICNLSGSFSIAKSFRQEPNPL
ncbi:MAG: peptide ABC transporter substrate-binding protein [Parachlamydiaceae bacterium]|nr:peptide ABC transporter substrate-binding protein [Parachlamydiaceae bacterium]